MEKQQWRAECSWVREKNDSRCGCWVCAKPVLQGRDPQEGQVTARLPWRNATTPKRTLLVKLTRVRQGVAVLIHPQTEPEKTTAH